MKNRVYMETSVVSYLKSRRSRDLIVAAHQELTSKWWSERAPRFEILISELVHREVAAGDPAAATARLEALSQRVLFPGSTQPTPCTSRLQP